MATPAEKLAASLEVLKEQQILYTNSQPTELKPKNNEL